MPTCDTSPVWKTARIMWQPIRDHVWYPIWVLLLGLKGVIAKKKEYKVFLIGVAILFAILGAMKFLGAPHLAREIVAFSLLAIVLIAAAETAALREAMEREAAFEQLLSSPDLEDKFKALSLRLNASDAGQLRVLQSAMEFAAQQARDLAAEIEKHKSTSKSLQEQREREWRAAEAVSNLLTSEVGRVAEIIEQRGRRSQWMFLILGAILGVVFQEIFQLIV